MVKITNGQFASLAAVPVVTIVLVWTVAVFQKYRPKWTVFDVPIVALFLAGILRNLAILAYITVRTVPFQYHHGTDSTVCTTLVWCFNTVHSFEAGLLATMAIISWLKVRRRSVSARSGTAGGANRELVIISRNHAIYHTVCLLALSTCIGVAAILAQNHQRYYFLMASRSRLIFDNISTTTENGKLSPPFLLEQCPLMPFELDEQYYIFVMVLHGLLATIGMTMFLGYIAAICNGTASNIDELAATINDGDFCASLEYSNNNTVSSVNSRRPCLLGTELDEYHTSKSVLFREADSCGVSTIQPVLIVSYLFYHLPLIILSAYPSVLTTLIPASSSMDHNSTWTVQDIVLILGILQDLLIPSSLCLFNGRFAGWVAAIYNCRRMQRQLRQKSSSVTSNDVTINDDSIYDGAYTDNDKNANHPSSKSSTISNINNNNTNTNTMIRFPITNGSLYASLESNNTDHHHLYPMVHNYHRRNSSSRRTHGLLQNSDLNQHFMNINNNKSRHQAVPFNNGINNCLKCLAADSSTALSYSNLMHQFNPNLSRFKNSCTKYTHNIKMKNSPSNCTNSDNVITSNMNESHWLTDGQMGGANPTSSTVVRHCYSEDNLMMCDTITNGNGAFCSLSTLLSVPGNSNDEASVTSKLLLEKSSPPTIDTCTKSVDISEYCSHQRGAGADDVKVGTIVSAGDNVDDDEDIISITTEANGDFEYFHQIKASPNSVSPNDHIRQYFYNNSNSNNQNNGTILDDRHVEIFDNNNRHTNNVNGVFYTRHNQFANHRFLRSVPDLKQVFIGEYI